MGCNRFATIRCVTHRYAIESTPAMLKTMTVRKPAGEKVIVNARIDAADVAAIDELARQEGTIHFNRSRSELIGFAVREYVQRHGKSKPKPGK